MEFDLIIKGGTIFDGSGKRDGFVADVGIVGNKIMEVGSLDFVRAKKIINVDGLYVAPGFIDVLNHSDTYLTLFTFPKLESLISQGITTIIGGNCGASLAPWVSSQAITSVQKWTDPSQINVNWLRMSEFLNYINKKENFLPINFATLIGYSTVRNGILDGKSRKLKENEIKIANYMIQEAIDEGGIGASSGLAYSGEKFVDDQELEELAKTIKSKDGILTVHLRNEADNILDALSEVIGVSKRAGNKLHISHLKVMGRKNWDKFDAILEMIEKAKDGGVDITFDVFPYASSGIPLYTILPSRTKSGSKKEIIETINNPDKREEIKKHIKDVDLDYKKTTIASFAGNPLFIGKTISKIAQSFEKPEEEVILDILTASELKVIVFSHVLSEENLQKAIKHPLCMVATDGAGYSIDKHKIKDLVHPRSFGAFPRYLRKYPNPLNEDILSYKEAIYKITGFPAERFKISKRGLIKKGYFADITIFDKDKIEELTTFEDPFKYSVGVNYVIVNGEIIFQNDKFQDKFYGFVIKKGK